MKSLPLGHAAAAKQQLLRGNIFDSLLVFGTLTMAVTAWVIVYLQPDLFFLLLTLDLWLLGYHHVIATFTRIGFDRPAISAHKYELFILPLVVFATVMATIAISGIKMIVTIYLIWQLYHYLRQSEGIAKSYLGRNGLSELGNKLSIRVPFYLIPTSFFITALAKQPNNFLTMPIFTFSIPNELVYFLWLASVLSIIYFVYDNAHSLIKARFPTIYLSYSAIHLTVFFIAYGLMDDLDVGWLGLNIWHNSQYLLFVWLANVNRFKDGVDKERFLISYISQPERWYIYFLVLFLITVLVYTGMSHIIAAFSLPLSDVIIVTVLIYQTVNFHHYIVDSRIWKLRKPTLQKEIGLRE